MSLLSKMENSVVAIVLGSDRFPRSALDSKDLARAFAASKAAFVKLLVPLAAEVFDRFGSTLSPNALCREIGDFLRERQWATDLIVYYVGHGGFLEDQQYFLALRETETDQEHATALRARDLATTLKMTFSRGRSFLIMDCCFAGSLVDSFQGPLQSLIDQEAARGVALLNAASRDKAAVVPPGGTRTMFSDCLCEVLSTGVPGGEARLTLREVRDAVWRRIGEKYPTQVKAWPEVHSPRMHQGLDVADFPLFPNAAVEVNEQEGRLGGLGQNSEQKRHPGGLDNERQHTLRVQQDFERRLALKAQQRAGRQQELRAEQDADRLHVLKAEQDAERLRVLKAEQAAERQRALEAEHDRKRQRSGPSVAPLEQRWREWSVRRELKRRESRKGHVAIFCLLLIVALGSAIAVAKHGY